MSPVGFFGIQILLISILAGALPDPTEEACDAFQDPWVVVERSLKSLKSPWKFLNSEVTEEWEPCKSVTFLLSGLG